MKKLLCTAVGLSVLLSGGVAASKKDDKAAEDFNYGWKFKRIEKSDLRTDFFQTKIDDSCWNDVTLPHTPRIEPAVVNDMWMGDCWYRKSFEVISEQAGKKVFVEFEGAMQKADVWINGTHIITHKGGYLPFVVDISDYVKGGVENVLAVKLDNRYDQDIPPGKPLNRLDFSWYGGLYRNVKLIVKDKLHITNAIYADKVAGGGVFVTYPKASKEEAQIKVRTHLLNESGLEKTFALRFSLISKSGDVVTTVTSGVTSVGAGEDVTVEKVFAVKNPQLWSPRMPNLYELQVDVIVAGEVIDREVERIGIRRVKVSSNGFYINGEKIYLRGTNRHQEYPYVGYALSDNMQYRDARKIKDAGFDLVRLSHYPQSPAFLDACDELGIVVMNAIPGWQFYKGGQFAELTLKNTREMIRRDRNNASSIFWEASLNETHAKPAVFMKRLHEIVHEEYPGDQAISAGWKDKHYDLFIPARQHARGPVFWNNWKHGNKAIFTAEYGDWEYFANRAANFNQTGAKALKREESNSRQRRGDGEVRLLQQALNYQESHNQNHVNPAMIGDANWLFIDANRGARPDHCESGVIDIFRIPKFSYYFFQSQRNIGEKSADFDSGAMVYIASWWDDKSPLNVRVFSNCDEVELFLNGKSLGHQKPDQDIFCTKLNHPPFTFKLQHFEAGILQAKAYVGGVNVAEHVVRTPEKASAIEIIADYSGKPLKADGADAVLVYAKVVDKNGTVVPDAVHKLTATVDGPAKIVGPAAIVPEAGIGCVMIQ